MNISIKILLLSLCLFISCSKDSNTEKTSNGEISLKVQATSEDFANDLINGKMASNYSYEPTQSSTVDFNEDYIVIAELKPYNDKITNKASSKLLVSNANKAENLSANSVYSLLVFDNSGNFVAKRNYTRGSESTTESLILASNTSYTFIAYSLNTTSLDDLNNLLYLEASQNPTLSSLTSTSTLSNTYILGVGNQDLLFYRKQLVTDAQETQNLGIVLKHQYNLLQTTIDVSDTGYEISTVATSSITAQLVTTTNSVEVRFNADNSYVVRESSGSQSFTDFTYEPFNGVENSIATSNSVIINTQSGENLLEISRIRIGSIDNPRVIKPFTTGGVPLTRGYKYNLSVRIVPTDGYTEINGIKVARINGQLWMRYNVGANYNLDPDDTTLPTDDSQGILGDYYQWGAALPVANAFYRVPADVIPGRWSTTIAKDVDYNNVVLGWIRPTPTGKGPNDPCPTGFRLPTSAEYNALMSSTVFLQNIGDHGIVFPNGLVNSAAQIASKRKKSIILTLPFQGFVAAYNGWPTAYSKPYNITEKGTWSLLKDITYEIINLVSETVNGPVPFNYIKAQAFMRTNTALTGTIFTIDPQGIATSAHTLRCIAIPTSTITLNDRVVDTNTGTVGF
ncbi:hypothetical protein [Sphingobacterium rhinopitheci]|uniref:hypothetical protein n=1 Tax=Sphingobacterium rhinopitheci TaxID=2781960 RepID=UPI001F52A866|nr:hypothetical protein [Sphingobacterium rhinopitheci]MCI0922725.1 hypothetical protein [Sphingobacterium rhinopitheci]